MGTTISDSVSTEHDRSSPAGIQSSWNENPITDQSKEPRERNNPSQATPNPHPDYKIRHDLADAKPPKKENLSKEQERKKSGTR
jgi:hypothetical protein